jgi:hypothetical protein
VLAAAAVAVWPFARVTVANPLAGPARVSDDDARTVVNGLLRNVYRAFDYREESHIYDVLERSVDGDLLTDIYLETQRALVLQNQGGARAKVKEIEIADAEMSPLADEVGFVSRCTWNVSGAIGHWGHIHVRKNQYQAELTVKPVEGVWKITGLELLSEQRL